MAPRRRMPTIGGDGDGRARGRGGFTLVELLTVIGIAVIMMALMVPTGRALREGNRAMTCKSQLQQIAVALKAYVADEGAPPPFYIDSTEDPTSATPHGPGLLALHEMGYLHRRDSLHCPSDVYTRSGTPEFLQSYQRLDPDVDTSAGVPLDAWSYLCTRGIYDSANPYYRRQLQPARAPVGAETAPVPVADPSWNPADSTVITWCPFHKEFLRTGDYGQYQVLFWDGSVVRITEDIMTDPAVAPDLPWKVSQSDGIE